MRMRMVLAAALLLGPGVAAARAQTGQERLLPAQSQLYLHWDGMKSHRDAFRQTAVGKMMTEAGMGKFLKELWKYAQETGQLAAQNDPQVGPWLTDASKLLANFYEDGALIGVEVGQINPPRVHTVLVFPKSASETGTLLPLMQKVMEAGQQKVKDVKVGARFVHQVQLEGLPAVHVGWWGEGGDAVIYVGTEEPAGYARDIDEKKTGLAEHPIYKKVRAFKEFPTCTRGFFDVAGLAKVVGDLSPEAARLVDELGLKGIAGVTFVSGFDGLAERGVTEIETPEPRKGLVSLWTPRKISLKDLPNLPADVKGFSAANMDLSNGYDVLMQVIDGAARIFAPNEADNIKETIKAFEGVLGVKLKEDLFGTFGNVAVSYSSPTEGFLGLGRVAALQVKDGAKLGNTLETLVKAIPALPGVEFSMNKKPYQGGDILELNMKGPGGNNLLATFGIQKGWFVYSAYPQPIKGFFLRQAGELPAWKAPPELTKELGHFPKEYTAVAVSDPRPTLKTILSILPPALNLMNAVIGQAVPGARSFDIDLVPHAEQASRYLFPNVTVTTDDGKKIRSETRGSLPLP